MKVTTIAHTSFDAIPEDLVETNFIQRDFTNIAEGGNGWTLDSSTPASIDILAEFAGRACYQAWEMPNPKTAENEGYLANILNQGHFSVLEHGSVTFYIEGVSRSLTHELIRHRHLSYSELSQRYVDVEDANIVTPPAFADEEDGFLSFDELDVFADMREAYVGLVEELTEKGYPRKRAREAARAVMPNAVETKIVVTGNLRAWRDFLGKRWHVAADAEIRELAGEILSQLREVAPNSVQDIPEEPFE